MQSFIASLNKVAVNYHCSQTREVYELAVKEKNFKIFEIFQGKLILQLRSPALFFTSPINVSLSDEEPIYESLLLEGSPLGFTKNHYDMYPEGGSEITKVKRAMDLNDITFIHNWGVECMGTFFRSIDVYFPEKFRLLFGNTKVLDVTTNIEKFLKFSNGYLDDDQKVLIYYIVGNLFDVKTKNLVLYTGKRLGLDIDVKKCPESFNIFEKILDSYYYDYKKIAHSITKSNGYHFYFTFDGIKYVKNSSSNTDETSFFLIEEDDNGNEIKRTNLAWDIRSVGGCCVESGIYKSKENNEILGAYSFQKLPVDSDGVNCPDITHMTYQYFNSSQEEMDDFNTPEEMNDILSMFSRLFTSRKIYLKKGKYYVKEPTEKETATFLSKGETPVKEANFVNILDAKAIINESNFDIVEQLFGYFTEEEVVNRTQTKWTSLMTRLKYALDPSMYKKGRKFFYEHCEPYHKAHPKRKGEDTHKGELDGLWAKIDLSSKTYPTLHRLCDQFMEKYISDKKKHAELVALKNRILSLVKPKESNKFKFAEKINNLDYSTFHTISKDEIAMADIDTYTDIINPENNRPYFFDQKTNIYFGDLSVDGKNRVEWTLQQVISWMKKCIIRVNNDNNHYYLYRSAQLEDNICVPVCKSTTFGRNSEYSPVVFEEKLNQIELYKTTIYEKDEDGENKGKGKTVVITALDVLKKFSRYITVSNVIKDFKRTYFYFDDDVDKRYLSLYTFQALGLDDSIFSPEDKHEFLTTWITSLCNLCGLSDEEMKKTLEEFKSGAEYTNSKFKLALFFYADMVINPHHKPGISIYYKSLTGTGKDIFHNFLIDNVIGENYSCTVSGKDISDDNKFNDIFSGKLLTVVEEIKADAMRGGINFLKELVTNPKIAMQQKFEKAYTSKHDFNRVVLYTNETRFLSANDRRFFLLNCNKSDDKEFIAKFNYYIGGYLMNSERKHYGRTLYDYLISFTDQVTGFNFQEALANQFENRGLTETMNVVANLSPVERFVYGLFTQEIKNTYFEKLDSLIEIRQDVLYNLYVANKGESKSVLAPMTFKARFLELFNLDGASDYKRLVRDGTKNYHYIIRNPEKIIKEIFTKNWKIANEYDRIFNTVSEQLEDKSTQELLAVDDFESLSQNNVQDKGDMISKSVLKKKLEQVSKITDLEEMKKILSSLLD